jgi:hypothetical protein
MIKKIKQRYYNKLHNSLVENFTSNKTEFDFIEYFNKTKDINKIYAYFNYYYNEVLPNEIKQHREYFEKSNRGFGERAFHAMWFNLITKFKPQNFLEIGVFRGQVVSLVSLISKTINSHIEVFGISPFSNAGDSVSTYSDDIDYYLDVIHTFEKFDLSPPNLTKAYSNEIPALDLISRFQWDMIYIDGSHEYDDVLNDYHNCKNNLKKGGLLIIDDSSLFSSFNCPNGAFNGHEGPSLVVENIVKKELLYVASVGHNSIFVKI